MSSSRLVAVLACASLLSLAGPAEAVRPPRARMMAPGLEAKVAVRDHLTTSWNRVPTRRARAWARFAAAMPGWEAIWDDATQVPIRLWGRGLDAPGAVADAGVAAAHARAMLARHIDLLAPGARLDDFVVVGNHLGRGVRTIGLRQHAGGMVVLGGQVSFRYKHDRLIAIGSEALPDVVAAPLAKRVEAYLGRLAAQTSVSADLGAAVTAGAVDGPFVLPLVGDAGVLGYRTVLTVAATSATPRGAWQVYIDASTGEPIARRQTLAFADGTVQFDVPVRRPGGDRAAYPARAASFVVDGAGVESDEAGLISWAGTATGALTTRTVGPLVAVANQAGDAASAMFSLAPGGTVVWDASGDGEVDAQLTGFIHARLVKDYARARFASELAWLDTQLPVNVNIADECNAYSDGESINFFQASDQCENTGRLPDVIYHEFGHSLHAQSLVDGVGAFDGAFSEGLSDYLAAAVTGDPGMGRGFFHNDSPLRHIDPNDGENSWPDDIGEVHFTGLIFAGAMWDLRKLLVAKYGADDGSLLSDRLFYGAVQRASSIPATYVEVLVEDDDDGDLANGTPNACEINAAFAGHGLRQVAVAITPLGAEAVSDAGYPVGVKVAGLLPQCAGDGVAAARLTWLLRGRSADEAQAIDMVDVEGEWQAAIPSQPEGSVVRYQVEVTFSDGSTASFPDNRADQSYEFYVGEVVPLYCTDFETDPFAEGWSHGLSRGDAEEGADDWTWATPMAASASGDPTAAYSGTGAIGNDLGGESRNGTYQPDKTNYARSPAVDLTTEGGLWSDVRVQYRRWLTVEDGFFDQAAIRANGALAWQNFNSNDGDQSATQHTDREWRFHDVPVSKMITGDSVQIDFELASDGGLEFGGWTVDDFCVVAAAGKVCGDGVVTEPEQCDEGPGNDAEAADACRPSCKAAFCGDGVVDGGESCDDGNGSDGDGCSATCQDDGGDGGDCGCEVGGARGVPRGSLALTLVGLVGLLALRRRRR